MGKTESPFNPLPGQEPSKEPKGSIDLENDAAFKKLNDDIQSLDTDIQSLGDALIDEGLPLEEIIETLDQHIEDSSDEEPSEEESKK